MMMRVTLPFHPSSSSIASSDLFPAAPGAAWSRCKQLGACFTVCAIPARDVVINFGKFKGSQMGTLPCSYLRWLIKEGSKPGLAAWGDYAKQVLEDPHYQDRLEWESVEKLTGRRGDMRRGGKPMGNTTVKGTMLALGWDLSDRDAWYRVNFSLLGTSLGGRIPRKKPEDSSVSSPETAGFKPRPTIPKPKSSSASPPASRMFAMKGSLTGTKPSISNLKQPYPTSPSSVSRTSTMKDSLTGANPAISKLKQPAASSLTTEASLMDRYPTISNLELPSSRVSTAKASLAGQNLTISNLKQPVSASSNLTISNLELPSVTSMFSSRVSTAKAPLAGQNLTISNLKQPVSASSPSFTSKMSTPKTSGRGKLVPPSAKTTPDNQATKSSSVDDATYKQDVNVEPPSPSLREELHRRRLLRKDRSISKSLNKLLSDSRKAQALFPGREVLLEKANDRADK